MKSSLLFQNQPAFEISDAGNKILVSADHGARILRWTHEGREVITWPDNADWTKILKVRGGNPVLFPFIARHFVDGKNEFWRDATNTVRPMPQHGFARNAKFAAIDGEADDALRLRILDTEETRAIYPFSFQFDVVVSLLSGSRLEIRFETTNRGDKPLPYYAGHHFFLPIPHGERKDWTLHLPCESWGRQNPDGSIVHEKATTGSLHLDDPALIDRFQIQPADTTITLTNNKTSQRLLFELENSDSLSWYAVTTWTEAPTSDFYCIEPWLGLPNAIHHKEGLRWLGPHAKEIATCILDASGW